MAFIDMRLDIAAGVEPYAKIMATVSGLASDEPLELITPFEPIPLYHVMEKRGFEHIVRRIRDNGWHVTFQRVAAED